MEKEKIDWAYEIKDFLKMGIASALAILLLTNFIARPVRVNQSSMYPTLIDQQLGIVNVLALKTEGIQRFDIVIIKMPSGEYLVKRVIGLPNETISFYKDTLRINGMDVKEPFLNEEYKNEQITLRGQFTDDIKEITLGDNELYCIGDNRPYSKDSRQYGPFTVNQIVGKDMFLLYPTKYFGGVK